MKVEITYDPYRMKTKMRVDGKDILRSESYEKFKRFIKQGLPLQSWIDPIAYTGWKGFVPELIGDTQESMVTCRFEGRKLDFDDFIASIQEQSRTDPPVNFEYLTRFTMDDKKVLDNLNKAVQLILSDKFSAIINDPLFHSSDTLKSALCNLPSAYQRAMDGEFHIVFAGMYSSGKSTIINALIGKEILPTSDGTCTSKVFNIRHDKNVKFARMRCIDSNKDEVVPLAEYNQTELEKKFDELFPYNENGGLMPSNPSTIDTVEIWTDLSSLYPNGFEDKFKIVLVDTPGTSSGEGNDVECGPAHIDITSNIINSPNKEIVIFTTTATEDKDDSIKEFLEIIDNATEDDRASYNQRFLFVLNKADGCQFEKGETFHKKLKSVEAYYAKGRTSLQTPRFFPVSAMAALEIKLDRTKSPKYKSIREHYYTLDEESNEWVSVADSENYYFDEYCSTSQKFKDTIAKEIRNIDTLDIKMLDKISKEIFLHSGIPSLEMAIKDYIERYAFPLKIKNLLNTFDGILSETKQINELIYDKLKGILDKTRGLEDSKNAKQEERQVEEKRKERLKTVNDIVKSELRKLKESDESSGIYTAVGEIKANMQSRLAPIRKCLGRYNSKTEAITEIESIFDNANIECTNEISNLGNVYLSHIQEITAQVKNILESVRDIVQFDGFNIEETIAFKAVSKTLLEDISPKNNYIPNPEKRVKYGWWQFIKKLKQTRAPNEIQDGYRFNEYELAEVTDRISLDFNNAVNSYQDKIINRLHEIENSVEQSLTILLDEMGKISNQLSEITAEIDILSYNMSDAFSKKEDFEAYRELIFQIQEHILFTQNGDI